MSNDLVQLVPFRVKVNPEYTFYHQGEPMTGYYTEKVYAILKDKIWTVAAIRKADNFGYIYLLARPGELTQWVCASSCEVVDI